MMPATILEDFVMKLERLGEGALRERLNGDFDFAALERVLGK
jgi:hypothetical protein